MKRANQPRKQIFPASLISAYQHSINIFEPLLLLLLLPSRSRIYANLLPFTPPPLYLYFQHLYISDPIVFFLSRAFLSNIFQENKFEGAKDTVFQSYTENLETLKKKKENLSGLKFNHPKNIREKKKDPKIKEFNRTLKP